METTKSSWTQLQMSGNPTNDGYFLDTCVYVNYGVPDNEYHKEAVGFFSKDCYKHTSDSVIVEIDDFKSFMSRFGRDLNRALERRDRRLVFSNPWLVFQNYNQNQRTFIEDFLHVVVGRPPPQISEEYRFLKGFVSDRIEDALSKTTKPYIAQSNDDLFLKLIMYVQDDGDRQIIADAALWATGFHFRNFCTSDNQHIMEYKEKLELSISKHYGRNCLVFVHLENA